MLIFYNTLEVFTMKYKFETTPEKSKQMAKVHSKNGKDELIIRKRYGTKVLDIELIIKNYRVNLI